MPEEKDLTEEIKHLKEEMNALKQQLQNMTDQLTHKSRGIYIDVNDRLTGLSDYISDVMEGVTEGIRGELEKSVFIHPHTGEVRITHRGHEHHPPPEHVEKADLHKAANMMSALGQEHRLKILSELMTGGKYISDLQNTLPEITASTLSSHLDVLQEAGLVVQERVRGRYLITIPGRMAYRLTTAIARQRDRHSEETPHSSSHTHRTKTDAEDDEDSSENEKEE